MEDKANPNPGRSLAHDFDCGLRGPCRCRRRQLLRRIGRVLSTGGLSLVFERGAKR